MPSNIRKIRQTLKSQPTIEGAGVRLKRVFGSSEVPLFDPFLLLDEFHSDRPEDYIAGFPWHPHRGIETITYLLNGEVQHQDSLGNKGIICEGDVQWMTAGSGIIHQEMPQVKKRLLWGFQLWANLPASQKMMDPRYQDLKEDQIPWVEPDDKVRIKIISGEVDGVKGPVQDIITEPEFLDLAIGPDKVYEHPVREGHTVFCYVIQGEGSFEKEKNQVIGIETVVLFEDGNRIQVSTGKDPVRFLLISGRPLGEPVAWQGPIVMNTQKELEEAFEEYRKGTFIKNRNLMKSDPLERG